MKTEDYANELKSAINYIDYATLVYSLGNSLNSRKDRFDKSDIIEQSIEVYSEGRLRYVDDVGRDHIDTKYNLDIEFKFVADGIFTKKRKVPKDLVKVKLKNSLGKHKGTKMKFADFYIIGQQDSLAIISGKELEPHLVAVPDGIEAHVPFETLYFIFKPENISEISMLNLDYKKAKLSAQRKIILEVREFNQNKS